MKDKTAVLIVAAMDRELDGLRTALDCTKDAPLLGCYPTWVADAQPVRIVQTHVGEINAAIASAEAIRQFGPACVLKLGCVGGHSAGIHTSDIVAPVGFFHSGAWITRDFEDDRPTPDATRWQSLYGELPYQVNSENLGGRPPIFAPDAGHTQRYVAHLTAQGLRAVEGYIGSSSMWFFDQAFMQRVLKAQVPDPITPAWAADMESYAIAQACAVHNVPFSGIYRVSNSDYYGEPYDPPFVSSLFTGAFIETIAAYLRELGTEVPS